MSRFGWRVGVMVCVGMAMNSVIGVWQSAAEQRCLNRTGGEWAIYSIYRSRYLGQDRQIMPDRIGPGERWDIEERGSCEYNFRNRYNGKYLSASRDERWVAEPSQGLTTWIVEVHPSGGHVLRNLETGRVLSQDRSLHTIEEVGPGEAWSIEAL